MSAQMSGYLLSGFEYSWGDKIMKLSAVGEAMKARRRAQRLTQLQAATALGISRATLAQWETGKHLPSADNAQAIDDYFGAGGALAELVASARVGVEATEVPTTRQSLATVFDHVGRKLVDRIVLDDRGLPGWRHHLQEQQPPTAWSTAYGIKIMLLLGEPAVDLDGLVGYLEQSRVPGGGWSIRSLGRSRPESNAVVVDALARAGAPTASVDEGLALLAEPLDPFSRSRIFTLTTILEVALRLCPDAEFVHRLLDDLLRACLRVDDVALWAEKAWDGSAVEPSLVHTARAVVVAGLAGSILDRADASDAAEEALAWVVSQDRDIGVTETLRPDPHRAYDIPIRHFTAAWTVRAIAGVPGVPGPRLRGALHTMWSRYVPSQALWAWGDGDLPIWMTHDAVVALRHVALASLLTPFPTPLALSPETDCDPTTDGDR